MPKKKLRCPAVKSVRLIYRIVVDTSSGKRFLHS
jgi:hypothetical protein